MSYRFPQLYNAIKAEYAYMTIMASAPGFNISEGAMWDYHQVGAETPFDPQI